MTLQEYYEKYNNISKTHPYTGDGDEWDAYDYHWEIIEQWQSALSASDLRIVRERERRMHHKMGGDLQDLPPGSVPISVGDKPVVIDEED